MRRHLSELSGNIPEGWIDTSTMRFMIPSLSDPRSLNKTAGTVGNVVITWEPAKGRTPLQFLREQQDDLRKTLTRFRLLSERNDAEMPLMEYTFKHGDKALQQVMCLRAVGEQLVCIVGSARETSFGQVREQILSVATSIA